MIYQKQDYQHVVTGEWIVIFFLFSMGAVKWVNGRKYLYQTEHFFVRIMNDFYY